MNLIALAESKGLLICAAESLTAGRVATEIANTPGASKVFLGSIVSYSDSSKVSLLGVASELIATNTAVAAEVALQMAVGVRDKFAQDNTSLKRQVVALSTTGVAGPEPVRGNPIGLVFIGIASERGTRVVSLEFPGTRAEISDQATGAAIALLREELEQI